MRSTASRPSPSSHDGEAYLPASEQRELKKALNWALAAGRRDGLPAGLRTQHGQQQVHNPSRQAQQGAWATLLRVVHLLVAHVACIRELHRLPPPGLFRYLFALFIVWPSIDNQEPQYLNVLPLAPGPAARSLLTRPTFRSTPDDPVQHLCPPSLAGPVRSKGAGYLRKVVSGVFVYCIGRQAPSPARSGQTNMPPWPHIAAFEVRPYLFMRECKQDQNQGQMMPS